MSTKFIQDILTENYRNGSFINIEQVGEEFYISWGKRITHIFKLVKHLYLDPTWIKKDDVRTVPECVEFYSEIKELYEIIGPVNGYRLSYGEDLVHLLMSYARLAPDENERCDFKGKNKIDARFLFRKRFESYLGRQILVQQLTPQEILEELQKDFWRMRKIRTQRKKRLDRKLNNETVEQGVKTLPFSSLVVISNTVKCTENHFLLPLHIEMEIVGITGHIHTEEVPLGYCEECNVFFISKYEYNRLREKGVILCQIVTEENYKKGVYANLNSNNLKAESLLHQCGYSVSALSPLTTKQREEILRRVVLHGLYTKDGLLHFLDWLISINEKSITKDMSGAINKWKNDRTFVSSL